jgi:CRP-like cAMP-binding protein
LSALSADDFELIRPHLRTADLVQDFALVEVGETLKRAYLPHRGVISLVVKLAKGEQVQVAMIGRDSVFGSFSALGDPTALNSAVVLVPGVASTLDIDRLHAAADQSATFRTALVRHGLAVHAQIQQTAGCNASHTVESRLARCLLHTHDLSGGAKLVLDPGIDGADDRCAAQQRVAGGQHAAAGQFHSLQPGSHRDPQPRGSQQDFLRVLRHGQGAIRPAAAASLPCVGIGQRMVNEWFDRSRSRGHGS